MHRSVLLTRSSLLRYIKQELLASHTQFHQTHPDYLVKQVRESMEVSGKFLSVTLLLVLLLAATGEMGGPVVVAEARTCESQSHRFRGPCVRKSNCANVCRTEGFPDGRCRGFRRRCFCTTHCHHH